MQSDKPAPYPVPLGVVSRPVSHVREDGPSPRGATVARGENAAPCTPVTRDEATTAQSGRIISEGRATGRAIAAGLLRTVLVDARDAAREAGTVPSLSAESVARSLVVSRATVEKWADASDPAAMTLGDVIAARGDFAEAVLALALEAVRQRRATSQVTVDSALRHIGVAAGELSRVTDDALNDMHVDDAEARRILERLDAVDAATRRMRDALPKGSR